VSVVSRRFDRDQTGQQKVRTRDGETAVTAVTGR
jgi:hypothetical protein